MTVSIAMRQHVKYDKVKQLAMNEAAKATVEAEFVDDLGSTWIRF
jgi:uncharacterized protein YdbL (DUF1318 family)